MTRRNVAALATVVWVCSLSMAAADSAESIPTTPTGIRPILINAAAPGTVLQNSLGEAVDLTSEFGKRSTILVFYRAHW